MGILGIVLSVVSAITLTNILPGLWRVQLGLARLGVKGPMSLDGRSRAIIWGWALALAAGLCLILWAYH
jgi:hypothetical protein